MRYYQSLDLGAGPLPGAWIDLAPAVTSRRTCCGLGQKV